MIARFRDRFWIRAGVFGLAGAFVFVAVPLTFGQPEDGGRIRRSNEVVLDVVFSPGGGCQDRISDEIGNATESVRIQAFYYTSKPITDALIKARKRGVDVTVVLDKSQESQTYGKWRLLARAGIPIYFDAKHATANNKIVLIDDHTIITGSYNFTKSAEEENAENVLIIKHAVEIFRKYEKNFSQHLKHSKKYGG